MIVDLDTTRKVKKLRTLQQQQMVAINYINSLNLQIHFLAHSKLSKTSF